MELICFPYCNQKLTEKISKKIPFPSDGFSHACCHRISKELPILYFKGSQVEILSYDCELRIAFKIIANSADHGEMQCPQRFNWVFTVD